MTKVRRPYSRLYWELLDDPKFASVYDDDAAFACWTRLLIAADMAWPASAGIPHGTKKGALARLVSVGLVDQQAGSRYRIHGLDKERKARSEAAKAGAAGRWSDSEEDAAAFDDAMRQQPASNATGMRSHPDGNAEGMPSQDEPSKRRDKAETRQAEHVARSGVFDAMQSVEDLTGRPFGWGVGSPIFDTLAADVRDLGVERVTTEYRAVKAAVGASPIDPAGIVFGAHKRLFPIPDGPTGKAPKGKGFNPTSEEAWDAFGGKPDVA
jgi:hypothetical protein